MNIHRGLPDPKMISLDGMPKSSVVRDSDFVNELPMVKK